MRILLRSAIIGCAVTIGLVGLAVIPRADTQTGKVATLLLMPGILAGFTVGSGREHDLSFWLLTAMLNAVFYCLVAYGGLRAWMSWRTHRLRGKSSRGIE